MSNEKPSRSGGKAKIWLARFVLLAVASFSIFPLFEIGLRLTGVQKEFFFQLDPLLGATYIPGKKGWYSFPDGRQWVEINSLGYRDKEWTSPKPEGTVRVALLGDSYVASMEVPVKERFGELIEEQLNRTCNGTGKRYEVLNLGVVGFGTAQELESLRHRAIALEPDHVVQFFYTGNDLYNNHRPIDAEPNRLHYRLDDKGELEKLPFSVSDGPVKRWLRHHSRAYLFVRDRLVHAGAVHRAMMAVGLMQQQGEEGEADGGVAENKEDAETRDERDSAGNRDSADKGDSAANLADTQHLKSVPPLIEEAWALTGALVRETSRVAEQASIGYSLVTVPTKEEIEILRGTRPARDQGIYDEFAGQTRIKEICEGANLNCLDLTEGFARAPGQTEDAFFPLGGHWTPPGQRIVASELAPWIANSICVNL